MPISEKTRKILWGRSGNRCALCRRELVVDSTCLSDDSVVGDECHIVSGTRLGPRYDPSLAEELIDQPENLVLLCRVHHKMVDDQFETYSAGILKTLKRKHERWVSTKLDDQRALPPVRVVRIKSNVPTRLVRLTSGQDVLNVVSGGHAFSFDHGQPITQDEVELIAGFLQEVQDWGDLSAELGAGERVKAAYRISALLRDLEGEGFYVLGGRDLRRLEGGEGPPQPWVVTILQVARTCSLQIDAARSHALPLAHEQQADV